MAGNNELWGRHPQSEQLLLILLDEFKGKNSAIADFEQKLKHNVSSRILDWIDHFLLPDSESQRARLAESGFEPEPRTGGSVYCNPGARLPRIVLTSDKEKDNQGIALKVENVADFLHINRVKANIAGQPLGQYRSCCLAQEAGVSFLAVERRGGLGFEPTYHKKNFERVYLEAVESWKGILRAGEDTEDEIQVFSALNHMAEKIISAVGQDLAAHIVCHCERAYWLSRNHAGRIQKMRQDQMGLGWANHDHHNFRSSRHNFSSLIQLFTLLGFEERERFYAGKAAGWGTQVMEQPGAGLVLFLDVDLQPKELAIDFINQELPEQEKLGTVGLWCALHGDSILQAGLHHLAANYQFDALPADLKEHGIKFLAPFSDLENLKQSFSKGEVWAVELARIKRILNQRLINQDQANKFRKDGAVGSHFENIQRTEGIKGFNQDKVSNIIRRLDPRKA